MRCVDKITETGNKFYPEIGRGKLYGKGIASLTIAPSGEIKHAEVNKSSGHKELDDSFLAALRKSAPFSAFTAEMSSAMDLITITLPFEYKQE